MRPGSAELKAFEQTARGQHLAGGAYHFRKTDIPCEDAHDMGAAGDPDEGLVFFGIDVAIGINLKKLRVQRSLEETKHQFLNGYVDLR